MDCSSSGSSLHGIFSDENTGSGLSFPPPGDLPNPGIEPATPVSPALQADSLPTEPSGKPLDVITLVYFFLCFQIQKIITKITVKEIIAYAFFWKFNGFKSYI